MCWLLFVGLILNRSHFPPPLLFPSESEPPVDWTFYQMFWGLQSYFLNPIKAFDAWQVVTGHLNSILDLFKQYPISEEVLPTL
jgi:hypothetical protein